MMRDVRRIKEAVDKLEHDINELINKSKQDHEDVTVTAATGKL